MAFKTVVLKCFFGGWVFVDTALYINETFLLQLIRLVRSTLLVGVYRVGQIKRGQLTLLLVTSEPIYKIKNKLNDFRHV